MGIFEKLKNALFEEEYVEVEEKPKTSKIAKKKVSAKDKIKEKYSEVEEDEKPVAKKVVLPEKKEVHVEEDYDDDSSEIEDTPLIKEEEKEVRNTFKMIDDDDFRVDDEVVYPTSEPKIVKVIEKEDTIPPYSAGRSDRLYPSKTKSTGPQPYGIDETPESTVHEYNIYEKKEEKTYFKPSPIISPIYGILDKNYRKEDVMPKKEIRLSSSFSRDKVSVDDVRQKAFGKNDDVSTNKTKVEEITPTFDVTDDDNLLVDLSSDEEKPAVRDVTMGDALEYFQDLGLEYNVDYVDAGKKSVGRREKDNYSNDDVDTKKEEVVDKKTDDDNDDNLFDLIDSMYKEQD